MSDIITSVVTSSIVSGLCVLTLRSLIQNIIKHEYDTKLETLKALLKSDSDKEVETLKTVLESGNGCSHRKAQGRLACARHWSIKSDLLDFTKW